MIEMLNNPYITNIIALISMFAGIFAVYFTHRINKKIENFDKNQYNLAIDFLKDTLSLYKDWCQEYTKNINDNQYSIRNILFPVEIFQSIIISTTQRDDFLELKHSLLGIIMQINTINSLHEDIKSFGPNEILVFGTGYKDAQKKQLIVDLQKFKDAIIEFQKKFLK
jgi:hypothetical protein